MTEPRFIVSSVTGRTITGDREAGGGKPLPTSYYVLDRAYCHREAGRFDVSEIGGGDERRRLLAEARCAELNAWDAEAHGA